MHGKYIFAKAIKRFKLSRMTSKHELRISPGERPLAKIRSGKSSRQTRTVKKSENRDLMVGRFICPQTARNLDLNSVLQASLIRNREVLEELAKH